MVKGIVRKVDELGRITLPMEYRKTSGVKSRENSPAVMHLVGNVIRVSLKPEKAIGLTRFLDELGRLTLPIEIRKTLGFAEHQEVDMYLDGEDICIAKVSYGCGWCGNSEGLLEVNGHHICKKCALAVADAVMEG